MFLSLSQRPFFKPLRRVSDDVTRLGSIGFILAYTLTLECAERAGEKTDEYRSPKTSDIKTLGIVGISLHRYNQLLKNNSVTHSISKTSEKLKTVLNIVTGK